MFNTNIKLLICPLKCCWVEINDSETKRKQVLINKFEKKFKNNIKSGVFIEDCKGKILIVQSYNSHWGIPKGSQEHDEAIYDTAVRELYEETGMTIGHLYKTLIPLELQINKTTHFVYIIKCNKNTKINYLSASVIPTEITGIGWVKPQCLQDMINNNNIKVNYLTKKLCNIV